ncbi:N-acetylmuramoyl-L-alanine amidase [Profundibacterium mesophilum]|uniref:N-acetylmuramoyl-L-alanine amidase n=1 Tax=Profundibacterium mesophilum KAUST100406-0324 TaxID=1037889 RepID=A0A921TEF3_9RHOB|nr:N-acetylmuramoyl-L-alanine amidase [Profundibacterium mesophilum]KAF0675389.1 N-acetylmuramoyl-L-alanine amidase family 2 [Profundibacterium mesophilum KAUST100406-0324]
MARPDLIVLHYTAMRSADAAHERLCQPEAEVSAHYLITREGALRSLVPEARRAWHAGAGRWGAVVDVNSASIGIELDNDGAGPFAAPLMRCLERLLSDVMARHDIPPERVIGHSDCAPLRKVDPGPRFDWRRLALGGYAIWPGIDGAPELGPAPRSALSDARFAALCVAAGYAPGMAAQVYLCALRLRLAPWARGARGPADDRRALWLAEHFPVDARAGTA